MRRLFLIAAVAASLLAQHSRAGTFEITAGADGKAWRAILGSVGMSENRTGQPDITVAGTGAQAELIATAESRIVIFEGASEATAALGIRCGTGSVPIRQIRDVHAPDMQIIWEKPLSVTPSTVPPVYEIFAREKWTGAPLLAGKRTTRGAILWVAAAPGQTGIERFPYILQALSDLGWSAPAQTTTLWAFFDSAYRIRADPDYLARLWRRSGIGVLHVAAWHNMEPDARRISFFQS